MGEGNGFYVCFSRFSVIGHVIFAIREVLSFREKRCLWQMSSIWASWRNHLYWAPGWLSLSLFYFYLFIYFFFWERECKQGRDRERETENSKQAPSSELSAQSPMWGSNWWTSRSWPEPKLEAQPTETPRCPKVSLLTLDLLSSGCEFKPRIGLHTGRGVYLKQEMD